jgi:cysteine-S-conjugate beta-lyase
LGIWEWETYLELLRIEAAYTHGDEWLKQLLQYLWENYLLLEDFFKTNMPKVKVMKPEATYLIWLDFREYGMKNEELMKFTIENAKVGFKRWRAFWNRWRWLAAH